MLTKSDKKFIIDTISVSITENNKILVKEMIDLFSATNDNISRSDEKLVDTNQKIDEVLTQLKTYDKILDNHERRLDKVENTIFTTTTNP